MTKRLFDIVFSLAALAATLPVVAIAALLVWAGDGQSPFYRGLRVGRFGREFRMIKIRTMIVEREPLGCSSTALSDPRLTRLGVALRRFKIDELPQFWNVLVGDMSVVGPRPNLRLGGTDRYTAAERRLLSVRPGITDLASIVFSDEGEILEGSPDPHALYDSTIRPWKNRLALLYVEHRTIGLDLRLVWLTALRLVSKHSALSGVAEILQRWNVSSQLREVCARSGKPPVGDPPGQIA
jgi:lipopolysaccharide/colanic/teichoic acid biosynthesis glycosyltransferase